MAELERQSEPEAAQGGEKVKKEAFSRKPVALNTVFERNPDIIQSQAQRVIGARHTPHYGSSFS